MAQNGRSRRAAGGAPGNRRRRRSATKEGAARAYKAAEALGPIVPVGATDFRSDGSPRLAPGQVYVMRAGTVYHPAWCSAVAAKWDSDEKGLLIIAESTVGGRTECRLCEEPLTT